MEAVIRRYPLRGFAVTSSARPLRGFASMSLERRSEIASLGGKAAHLCGRGHQWTSEEAKAAGLKGAAANRVKRARLHPVDVAILGGYPSL